MMIERGPMQSVQTKRMMLPVFSRCVWPDLLLSHMGYDS
jgi:hypothetical protein